MPDPQDEHDDGAIGDVINNAVVIDADTEFAFASGELNSAGWLWGHCEGFDGACDSFSLHGMNFAEGFRSGWFIGDRVGHGRAGREGSVAQFCHEIVVGDAGVLASGVGCAADIGLIF